MKHCTNALLLSSIVLLCCKNEPKPTADEPTMFKEKPAPAQTVSESLSLPKTSTGNFESLVADYEAKDRGIWQKPELVISYLGDLKGRTVSDIGAGTGYFTFRLVPKAQKVIGIDIAPRFINFLDSIKIHLPAVYRDRFESRLAKPDDPMLAPAETDDAIIVNTYGYISERTQYLTKLAKGMSDEGRLLIIDFKKNNIPVGPSDEYKVSLKQVQQELAVAGFKVVKVDNEALDYQYIVLAVKSAPSAAEN